jgi:acetylglutamate kinase
VIGQPIVVKVGGELLERPDRLETVVTAMSRVAGWTPLVIVHGGGKEIDAALKVAGIEKRQVDGLRITDDATLDVVVGVLAGSVNTRLAAALGTAGLKAVGLTGADGSCGLSDVAPPHRSVDGRTIDLGRVGVPSPAADVRVVRTLLDGGFVPVVASIGVSRDGALLNVNADTLAGHLAAHLPADRLIVAGGTPGVLDQDGRTIPRLTSADIDGMTASGAVHSGMIAKLTACRHALENGVGTVLIVSGRDVDDYTKAAGTSLQRSRVRETV